MPEVKFQRRTGAHREKERWALYKLCQWLRLFETVAES